MLFLLNVGVKGFEPSTPCSQSRCANQTALHPELREYGGAEGIRTLDLFVANESRSQLRHSPSEPTGRILDSKPVLVKGGFLR